MKRFSVIATFLLAAYAAVMSTPGINAQVNQLFWPGGTEAAPGLAIQGTKSGFFVKGSQDVGVTVFGNEAAFFGTDGTNGKIVNTGGEDLGLWTTASGTLTASQVRNLDTTPVVILAAPGAGIAIAVESIQFMLDFNANPYNSAVEDLIARYSGENISLSSCSPTTGICLGAGASADEFGISIVANAAQELLANTAVELATPAGSWSAIDQDADGDSPVHWWARYRRLSTDLSQ